MTEHRIKPPPNTFIVDAVDQHSLSEDRVEMKIKEVNHRKTATLYQHQTISSKWNTGNPPKYQMLPVTNERGILRRLLA